MNPFVLMAGGGSQEAGSMYTTLVTFVLIILIFYFLIIRPQKKRDKEAKKMLEAMKKGDKVVSIGGIHGTIVQVKDQTVVVKVDDSARIEFTKSTKTITRTSAEPCTEVSSPHRPSMNSSSDV